MFQDAVATGLSSGDGAGCWSISAAALTARLLDYQLHDGCNARFG